MKMTYTGTAELNILHHVRQCTVDLAPEEERIFVRFPMDDPQGRFPSGSDEAFRRSYRLAKLNIDFPLGRVRGAEIPDLLLIGINYGTSSIYDSNLVRSLSLYRKEIGLTQLTFTPQRSLVHLPVEGLPVSNDSELVFYDTRITTNPFLKIKIGNRNAQLTGDKSILVVRSTRNLLPDAPKIRRALSLLQGGRILYRAGFYKRSLQINFSRQGLLKPLGTILDDPTHCEEFLTRYISFERSRTGRELKAHVLAVEYIINGCAGSEPLESKCISFFTALEIIDGSRTLNKTTVKSTLGISTPAAELIVGVRNRVIHEGMTLPQAILNEKDALLKKGRLKALPFGATGISKHKMASNFRFYILELLVSTIMSRIGMSKQQLSYRAQYM